jgi:hypothetical protein
MLHPFEQRRILRRQFPRRARDLLEFEVRWWEDTPWVAVLHETAGSQQQVPWRNRINEYVIASAPMLNVTKRISNKLIGYAVIDPELIAYVLLSL